MVGLLLSKQMTLSNKITIVRIAISPIIFIMLVNGNIFGDNIDQSWIDYFAGLLFVLASISDFFDGYIARELNQTTLSGSILDPLADKILMLCALLGLLYLGRADVWAIMLILSREFIITGIRTVVVQKGKDVSASLMGKAKTFLQIFAIIFLIMQWEFGEILLWISVFVTMYSGIEYSIYYYKILKESK
jgi:CDP-diacylglycerol--glycerol-3-phosphate 3-phosphatidyltransferase